MKKEGDLTGLACVLKTDGSFYKTSPHNGKHFKMEQIQDIVGGYFQIVATDSKEALMAVNEDAIALGLPINRNASVVAGTTILGDALVFSQEMMD